MPHFVLQFEAQKKRREEKKQKFLQSFLFTVSSSVGEFSVCSRNLTAEHQGNIKANRFQVLVFHVAWCSNPDCKAVQASQITQAGNFSAMIPLHKYTLPTSNLEIWNRLTQAASAKEEASHSTNTSLRSNCRKTNVVVGWTPCVQVFWVLSWARKPVS